MLKTLVIMPFMGNFPPGSSTLIVFGSMDGYVRLGLFP